MSHEVDQSFRAELQREFLRRREDNPSYSLRSFSRNLGIYHATLSAILSGRRPLTRKSIQALGAKIGMPPKKIAGYLAAGKRPTFALGDYTLLEDDTFASISHWYYDAILEMVRLPGFDGDAKAVADRLGISVHESRAALGTLQRLNLIEETKHGHWVLHAPASVNRLDENHTTAAHRQQQRQILEKSIMALDQVDAVNRSHTSTSMAIARADLPELKKRITRFRRELDTYAQRAGVDFDSVYQLSVSFFELTKTPPKKGAKE